MSASIKRILLMTSEPNELIAAAKEVDAHNICFFVCEEIEAAEALLSHHQFAAVVTDLQLSELGGFEGLKLIHHVRTHFPSTVIFAAVAEASAEIRDLVQGAGGQHVLEKPIDVSVLQSIATDKQKTKLSGHVDVCHFMKLEQFLKSYAMQALLQPIVGFDKMASTPRTLGVESLARAPKNAPRWTPEILFAYAERKEMLFETDLHCLQAALKEAEKLRHGCRLFMNVRPRSLINPSFFSKMTSLLQGTSFRHTDIVFELTEQQGILNQEAFSQTVTLLRDSGFGIALDDFGEGYANLKLLQELKPDYIKLSGAFCRSLDTDATKQVIVGAASHMASQLLIPMILENVETDRELQAAMTLGVRCAQGYYFCPPLSAMELTSSGWFDRHPAPPLQNALFSD